VNAIRVARPLSEQRRKSVCTFCKNFYYPISSSKINFPSSFLLWLPCINRYRLYNPVAMFGFSSNGVCQLSISHFIKEVLSRLVGSQGRFFNHNCLYQRCNYGRHRPLVIPLRPPLLKGELIRYIIINQILSILFRVESYVFIEKIRIY